MKLCEKCGSACHSLDKCGCGGDLHEIEQDAYNALVYRIAKRCSELADEKMEQLRLTCSSGENAHQRRQDTAGQSRGNLVEAIIVEEFVEELI